MQQHMYYKYPATHWPLCLTRTHTHMLCISDPNWYFCNKASTSDSKLWCESLCFLTVVSITQTHTSVAMNCFSSCKRSGCKSPLVCCPCALQVCFEAQIDKFCLCSSTSLTHICTEHQQIRLHVLYMSANVFVQGTAAIGGTCRQLRRSVKFLDKWKEIGWICIFTFI